MAMAVVLAMAMVVAVAVAVGVAAAVAIAVAGADRGRSSCKSVCFYSSTLPQSMKLKKLKLKTNIIKAASMTIQRQFQGARANRVVMCVAGGISHTWPSYGRAL